MPHLLWRLKLNNPLTESCLFQRRDDALMVILLLDISKLIVTFIKEQVKGSCPMNKPIVEKIFSFLLSASDSRTAKIVNLHFDSHTTIKSTN